MQSVAEHHPQLNGPPVASRNTSRGTLDKAIRTIVYHLVMFLGSPRVKNGAAYALSFYLQLMVVRGLLHHLPLYDHRPSLESNKLAHLAQTQAMTVSKVYHASSEACQLVDQWHQLSHSAKILDFEGYSSNLSSRARVMGYQLEDLCMAEVNTGNGIRHHFDTALGILALADKAESYTGKQQYGGYFDAMFLGVPQATSQDLTALFITSSLVLNNVATMDALVDASEDALRALFASQAVPKTSWWGETSDSVPIGPGLPRELTEVLDQFRLVTSDTRQIVTASASSFQMLLAQMDPRDQPVKNGLPTNPAALNELFTTFQWYKTNMDHDAKQLGPASTGRA